MSYVCNGCKQIKDEPPAIMETLDISEKYGDGATRAICYCKKCATKKNPLGLPTTQDEGENYKLRQRG